MGWGGVEWSRVVSLLSWSFRSINSFFSLWFLFDNCLRVGGALGLLIITTRDTYIYSIRTIENIVFFTRTVIIIVMRLIPSSKMLLTSFKEAQLHMTRLVVVLDICW
mmetsp:Transcript_10275/g.13581  ORF Transcript_10275/g.13581 Transcript_10275/m.13581 type:complete len:107 (-) Transcript_10275:58-378(-)